MRTLNIRTPDELRRVDHREQYVLGARAQAPPRYLRGDLVDHTWEDAELQESVAKALTRLPAIPG